MKHAEIDHSAPPRGSVLSPWPLVLVLGILMAVPARAQTVDLERLMELRQQAADLEEELQSLPDDSTERSPLRLESLFLRTMILEQLRQAMLSGQVGEPDLEEAQIELLRQYGSVATLLLDAQRCNAVRVLMEQFSADEALSAEVRATGAAHMANQLEECASPALPAESPSQRTHRLERSSEEESEEDGSDVDDSVDGPGGGDQELSHDPDIY